MEQQHYSQDDVLKTVQGPESLLQHLPRLDVDAAEVETEVAEETVAATLTTLLHQEAVSRRNETWGALAWSGAFIGSMLWLFRDKGTAQPSLALSLLLCFALMGSIGWGLCLRWGRRAYGRRRSLTDALARIDDKQQVGTLSRTLQVQDTPVCNRAKQSLIELLPALRASDASRRMPPSCCAPRRQAPPLHRNSCCAPARPSPDRSAHIHLVGLVGGAAEAAGRSFCSRTNKVYANALRSLTNGGDIG